VLAESAAAVAGIRGADVAVVRAGRPVRLEGVGRAGGAGAGAGLGEVALARRRTAHDARVARRVRARRARAVAHVGGAHVAVVRAGRPVRLDGVGRAGGAGAGARLGEVALVGRRAAHDARVVRRVLAESAAAVAGVGRAHVAVVRA